VRVVTGSLLGTVFGLTGQHAVTIDGTVHWTKHAPGIDTLDGAVLYGHELFHVVDQRAQGWWRYLVRYVWHWRPRHVKHGSEHPAEDPAYERSREIRARLEQAGAG
jgi:hypothetical protein